MEFSSIWMNPHVGRRPTAVTRSISALRSAVSGLQNGRGTFSDETRLIVTARNSLSTNQSDAVRFLADNLVSFDTTITLVGPSDRERLTVVWEESVRATHHFLSEADMDLLIPAARKELAEIAPIYCLRDSDGLVNAFMVVEDKKIEALFVAPTHRGSGGGRLLVEYAVVVLGACEVDVNEQNYLAVGFYEHLGFRTFGREPSDLQGFPFPILHMKLRTTAAALT